MYIIRHDKSTAENRFLREYYKTWYGYDVTDDELVQMLVY